MLREIVKFNDARRDRTVISDKNFDFENPNELNLEIIKDNKDRLSLNLIDIFDLNDSNNKQSSTSNMCVIDERHKLCIFLAFQKIENVYVICLIIRRDISFNDDFQNLVKQLRNLFMFSIKSSFWNFNYHIVHTNIDAKNRFFDLCKIRQQNFDDFGSPDVIHHFIDNEFNFDNLFEQFLINKALSNIFRSFLLHKSKKFSNLHYSKSPKHEHNNYILMNGIQFAIHQFRAII